MGWLPVVVVAFAALNALVIVLARDVTSRWERSDDPALARDAAPPATWPRST